jgi:cellulose synthase/poly-beta-1,6-N-acetylglucosamine synthase-like glycosyltransferase
MAGVQVVFWFALAWVAYATVGYLALLAVIARFVRRPVAKAEITPTVTVLIAVHNEEAVIRHKLENALALDYPRDRLQILVASDASSDRTDEMVGQFAAQGVELCRIPERQGKVAALRAAEPQIRGELVLFSDADSMYQPDALRKLVQHFGDPKVGAVSGHEIRRPAAASGQGKGEGLYCRYDNWIKELEGKVGSQIMVNGGFFMARRALLPPVPDHLNHDGILPYTLALQGYRTAYEPDAISYETYGLDSGEDWHRRVRTVLQSVHIFFYMRAALNPLRTGFYAVQIWSHRVCRYLIIPVLAVALVTNALLVNRGAVYGVLLALQLAAYSLATIGLTLDRLGWRPALFYFPFYFLLLHAAAFWAVLLALGGKQMATWHPTRREI